MKERKTRRQTALPLSSSSSSSSFSLLASHVLLLAASQRPAADRADNGATRCRDRGGVWQRRVQQRGLAKAVRIDLIRRRATLRVAHEQRLDHLLRDESAVPL